MGNIFSFDMVSADGYFAGPNGELDWHNVDSEFNAFAIQQLDEIDALLFGRITYQLMASYWPSPLVKKNDPVVASKMNSLPKYVASKTLHTVSWEHAKLIQNNVIDEIASLKRTADRTMAIFGSSKLSVSLLEAGLIDECRIMIAPVLLGEGQPLFAGLSSKVALKHIATKSFRSGNVLLTYQPTKL
jgi:dihydrofolate reductase